MKKETKKLREFLMKKEFEKWADGNQTFMNDLHSLLSEMMMFEIKYGTKILYDFEKPKKE